MKKIIPIIILIFWSFAKAQPITELEATPAVLSEPSASLLIQEVNFKNKQADWVKIIYTSPSNKPINLKGVSFADDKIFKTIEEDFIVASEQDILLTFKSEENDSMPYLYSNRTGLTGTTEQFIIIDQNGTILDAVCWTSTKPTESEIQEQSELFEQEGWHSSNILSCIPSDPVKTDESIQRQGLIDTNSAEDWIQPETQNVQDIPPLQPVNLPNATEVVPTATIKIQPPLETPELITVSTPIGTTTTSSQKSTKSSSSKTSGGSYSNGDKSNDIIISEILPNPDGTDSKKEWIELTNIGKTDINLGNWSLDDSEDGSKPYTIPHALTIQARTATIIESADSKLSLGNKEDSIRLFDYEGVSIDEIVYEEAPSGKSYSRITIEQEDGSIMEEWIWTTNPTPGQLNPTFQQFTAKIISEPHFEQTYTFNVRDQKNQEHTIIFDEELIAAPLAKATFTIGSTMLLSIEPHEKKLFQFEILAPAEQTSSFPPFFIPSIIGIMTVAAGSSFFLVHKKFPWQEAQKKI